MTGITIPARRDARVRSQQTREALETDPHAHSATRPSDPLHLDVQQGDGSCGSPVARGMASGNVDALSSAAPPPTEAPPTTASSTSTAATDGVTDSNGAPALSDPTVAPSQLSGFDLAALLTYFNTDSNNKELQAHQQGILANQTTQRAIGHKNLDDIAKAIKAQAQAAAKRRASHGWGLFKRIFHDVALTVSVTLVTVLKNPQSLENPATLFMLAQVSMEIMVEIGQDCGVDLEPSHLIATLVAKTLEACDPNMDHRTAMALGKVIALGGAVVGGPVLIGLDPTIAGEGVAGALTLEGHTSEAKIAAWSMGVSAAVGVAVAIALISVEGTKAVKAAGTEASAEVEAIGNQVDAEVAAGRLAANEADAAKQIQQQEAAINRLRRFAGHVARGAKMAEGVAEIGEAGLDMQAAIFDRDAAEARANQIDDKALADFVNHNLQAEIKAMKLTEDRFKACMNVVNDILKGYCDSKDLLDSNIGQSAA